MVTSLVELQAHLILIAACVETDDFLALPSMPERFNLSVLDHTQVDQARELLGRQQGLMSRLEEASVSIQRELEFLHTLEGSAKTSDAHFIDASL